LIQFEVEFGSIAAKIVGADLEFARHTPTYVERIRHLYLGAGR
jgi:hypothetical protein